MSHTLPGGYAQPRLLALAVSTFALAACNPFHREPVSEVTRDANVNARWHASLEGEL